MNKEVIYLYLSYRLLCFVILMPAVQIVLMGMSMGNDPHPLRLGVVTNESCDFDPIFRSVSPPAEGECIIANLSCRYLSTLPFDIVELVREKSSFENAMQFIL